MKRVKKTDNCWVWDGYISKYGYGRVKVNYKFKHVHRAVYEMLVSPIQDGLVLDHLCRNRACCNPSHLEPVTVKENILRGIGLASINSKKTCCKYGHPYDADNTYILKNKRYCKICERAKTKRLRSQKKELKYVSA